MSFAGFGAILCDDFQKIVGILATYRFEVLFSKKGLEVIQEIRVASNGAGLEVCFVIIPKDL